MSNLSKQITHDTAKVHFKDCLLDSLSDSLASIIAVEDKDVKKELACTYLVSSWLILSNAVGKDTFKDVSDYLRKKGLI